MFEDRSTLIRDNPPRLHYGVAVTDLDGDGAFEVFVAGFGDPNRVLKWNDGALVDLHDSTLADADRQSIGVAAGDLDGDGREELYVLNSDTFAGRKRQGDRLFAFLDGGWHDLFELQSDAPNTIAGRSVVAIDRDGDGRYGFFVANYGGPFRLYELNRDGDLRDVAPEAGLDYVTGGRSAVALPLVSSRMDVFTANERGSNLLFRNRGDGSFEEIARAAGVADPREHGRGIALLDGNGHFDLVYGNWEGPHRLFSQIRPGEFRDTAPPDLALPSRVRTVIAADWDNDGFEEIFFNNIGEPNRLFGFRDGRWIAIPIGDALEADGLGTGAAVADLDSDGRLELLIARGESERQPLSLYGVAPNGNNWLRVQPLTRQGAPARGAVILVTAGGRAQRRAIDAGSGYLCQMEPVAHIGLGNASTVERVQVRWPDGAGAEIVAPPINALLRVAYPAT